MEGAEQFPWALLLEGVERGWGGVGGAATE